jgi:hypothetical protein
VTLLKTHDSAATADKPRPARGSVSRTSIRRAHACRSHQRRGLRPRATEVPRDGLCLVYSCRMPSRAPAGPDSGGAEVRFTRPRRSGVAGPSHMRRDALRVRKTHSGLHFTVDLLSAEVSARPVRAASAPGFPARAVGGRPSGRSRVASRFHLISHFRVPSPRSRPRKRFVFRADFTLESAIAPYWALCISGLRPRGPPPPGSRGSGRRARGQNQTRGVRRPKRRIGARTSSRCILQRMVIRARW